MLLGKPVDRDFLLALIDGVLLPAVGLRCPDRLKPGGSSAPERSDTASTVAAPEPG
jgi:hypothetical protein